MLKEKWDAYSETKKKKAEIIGGILLAGISIFFLYDPFPNSSGFLDFSAIIAFVIALFVPRVLEKQVDAPLKILRRTLLIMLVAGLTFLILDMFVLHVLHAPV